MVGQLTGVRQPTIKGADFDDPPHHMEPRKALSTGWLHSPAVAFVKPILCYFTPAKTKTRDPGVVSAT
jgi:hypothetical protein